ncbi:hypothetical protein PRIPAC_70816, partial [Pristionchus pacificus]|uniref:Uncharacterized protein n=1 Tax=Pristionchus pacificus TaxID=54126 RepID=A0A2A6B567_PRIPA
ALKKRLNIPDAPMMSPDMMMAAMPAPAAAPTEAAAAEDVPLKMTFKVTLAKFDDTKKIALIKEIGNIIPGLR